MNPEERKILFISQDAGGFNAIFPVYKRLKQNSPATTWGIFGDVAKKLVKDMDVPFVDVTMVTRDDIQRLFDEKKPGLLVVGTSSGLSMDKIATSLARERCIPSVAVMDYWSNYTLRFSDPGTDNLAYLPDRIFVMDDVCKREMVKEGFDPKMITVTGNPYFDKFKKPLGKGKGKGIISFFSQPFSELKKSGRSIDYGYDEREVFRDLIEVLEQMNVPFEVVVKHHSRTQDLTVFDRMIQKSSLRIHVDHEMPTDDVVARSILVTGMSTMVLFEAALRGKSVLSYQPHLNREDPLISNRLRLSVAVYKQSQLLPALKKLLKAKRSPSLDRARRTYAHGRATANVIQSLRLL